MTDTVVHSARLITTGAVGEHRDIADAWVHLRGGAVVAVGEGDDWRRNVASDTTIVDALSAIGPGAILTPGLVDIHCHGGGGSGFDESPDDLATAAHTHLQHGVTSVVASLVSAPIDALVTRLATIRDAAPSSPSIIGAHLEGPFIDTAHCGAHDRSALSDPNLVQLQSLIDTGIVRQVTLAPELSGGMDAVRLIHAAGVTTAVGHTGADAATAQRAFDNGARLLTHTFNAMNPLHHREPGPVGAAIADERVTLEVVPDGHHVDPRVVAMLFRAAPGRVAIVSDAMAAAAAPDGLYPLGSLTAEVAHGVARIQGTATIAGSTLTLDTAVRNCVGFGVPLAEALAAATVVPARAIGRPDLGVISVGGPADMVLWDSDLAVARVWKAGESL
ncbi:amidohydrolase family protein [Microbacterium lacus]|uniref:N-acetylglucosamine-6-phosphate deacetylase n=1 Tax=Microbacterium lacus TaxID=415217 RepID=UPI00384D8B32